MQLKGFSLDIEQFQFLELELVKKFYFCNYFMMPECV